MTSRTSEYTELLGLSELVEDSDDAIWESLKLNMRPIKAVKFCMWVYICVCVYIRVCVCVCVSQVMVQLQGGMTSPAQPPRGQMSSVAGCRGSDRPVGLFISGKCNPNIL